MRVTCAQVQAEFKLMFEETLLKKSQHAGIMPVLMSGGVEVPKVFTEQIMYKAVEMIDKKAFHSSGVTAKSDPVFVIMRYIADTCNLLHDIALCALIPP